MANVDKPVTANATKYPVLPVPVSGMSSKFIPYHVPTSIIGVVITVNTVSNFTIYPVLFDDMLRYTCSTPVSDSA